jgi:hypothetical protein
MPTRPASLPPGLLAAAVAVIVNPPTPLDNFPLIRSRNIEVVREAIAQTYSRPVLVPGPKSDNFDTTLNNCQLQNVGVAYCAFHAAVSIEFPEASFFVQQLPIRGAGEIACGAASATIKAGDGLILSSDATHKMNYSADYETLILRIGTRALTEKLRAMTGAAINEPLQFAPLQKSTHPAAQMLRQYLPLFIDTLSRSDPPFPDWWVGQTEQLLMTLFLCGHQHNYIHLLERDSSEAALHQVRKAEEYIEAHAGQTITLEELAEATGASAFSLFSAFRKYRGYSPFEFLTQWRFKR